LRLRDTTSKGKLRPWEPRREQAIGVAAAYRELGRRPGGHRDEYVRISEAMMVCGTSLEFACACHHGTGDKQKRLLSANFCRGRVCPMCNWRRSRKLGAELEQVVAEIQRRNPGTVPVMLTLTERKPRAWELAAAVDGMSKGYSRLRKRKEWKRAVKASFRAVKVTRPRPASFTRMCTSCCSSTATISTSAMTFISTRPSGRGCGSSAAGSITHRWSTSAACGT
jgi:hypothetical protein